VRGYSIHVVYRVAPSPEEPRKQRGFYTEWRNRRDEAIQRARNLYEAKAGLDVEAAAEVTVESVEVLDHTAESEAVYRLNGERRTGMTSEGY
jgi:hypothetical protein